MKNSQLNNSQTCATITLTQTEFNEVLRRIEMLERLIISSRREVLRMELCKLEDGMKLERTVKRRVR